MGFINWGFWVMMILIIALFFAIVILATISLADVNKDKKKESDDDKEHYDQARYYLGWCIGIGWALVGIGIVLLVIFIVIQFFGGAEVEAGLAGLEGAEAGLAGIEAAEAGIEGAEGLAAAERGLIGEEISATKAEDRGLFDFNKIMKMGGFFGFVEKGLLFLSLAGLFSFGVLCAISATEIGKTSTKKGYTQAIWATVLGILPFSLIVIWFIGNKIYVSKKKEKVKELETKKKALEVKHKKEIGKLKGEIAAKSAAKGISVPVVKSSPQKRASQKSSPKHSLTSKTAKTVSSLYDSLPDEDKKALKNSAKSALKSALESGKSLLS